MKKSPEEIINDIQEACKLLGWQIAMDTSSKMVSGLILGRVDYVEATVGQLQDIDNYEIFEPGNSEEGIH